MLVCIFVQAQQSSSFPASVIFHSFPACANARVERSSDRSRVCRPLAENRTLIQDPSSALSNSRNLQPSERFGSSKSVLVRSNMLRNFHLTYEVHSAIPSVPSSSSICYPRLVMQNSAANSPETKMTLGVLRIYTYCQKDKHIFRKSTDTAGGCACCRCCALSA